MVQEGTVLGHRVSEKGIEVDRVKIKTIEKLSPPTNVKDVRNFLGHAGFYQRFIRDLFKITKPLCNLLMNGAPFELSHNCLQAFIKLKEKLTTTPIITVPYWSLPFEIMYDASDFTLGIVLEQRRNKIFPVVYFASRTLNDAQQNYTTIEKEFLVVVFTFNKFHSYLIGSKVIVFIDYSALKYLLAKNDAKL